MKKSFMTRVLAVSLSAAMAFSLSSANMVTASAASTVSIAKTKTLTVGTKAKLKLKTNTLDWKIYAASSSKKTVVKLATNTSKNYVNLNPLKAGTSKITVRVKSASRKKAGKTWKKGMTCTVTVKDEAVTPPPATEAATEAPTEAPTQAPTEAPTQAPTEAPTEAPTTPSAPAEDGWQINTLYASSRTTLEVTFSKAVDSSVTRDNFAVQAKEGSQAVAVTNVMLLENGMKAVLTMSGTEMGADYTLTASGLRVSGEAQGVLTGDFTTPMVDDEYIAELVVVGAEDNAVPAKNGANVDVIFQVRNQSGIEVAAEELNGFNVTFMASGEGNFASASIPLKDGKATNMFRVPVLASDATAVLTAMIDADSTNGILLKGLYASTNLLLKVKQDDASTDQGVVVTNVVATTADRVTAFFNRPVDAKEFKDDAGNILKSDKLIAKVVTGNDASALDTYTNSYPTIDVKYILPVEGNDKALELLLEKPLVNNAYFKLHFIDKRYSQTTTSKPRNYLVDARRPFLTGVKQDGNSLRKIVVTFSEAVISTGELMSDTSATDYIADRLSAYTLDGVRLDYILGVGSKVEVGTGADRNQVTITFGKRADGSGRKAYLSAGDHVFEAAGVGDWASNTTGAQNVLVTATRDLHVEGNDNAPAIKEVEIQSPEQYLVTFESEVESLDSSKTVEELFQFEYLKNGQWEPFSVGYDVIKVRSINESQYVVELQKDWTVIWNNKVTGDNYWNHQYRLKIDAKKLENGANGKSNTDVLTANLNGTNVSSFVKDSEKLDEPDGVSPRVLDVARSYPNGTNDSTLYYQIIMNEPIQYFGHTRYPSSVPCVTTPRDDKNDVAEASVVFYNPITKQSVPAKICGTSPLDDRILVQPDGSLSAGDWKVYIRSISDDFGNTIATDTVFGITVTGTVDTEEPFKVVWAVLGNNQNNYLDTTTPFTPSVQNGKSDQYIFIKFNRALSGDAFREYTYSLNGKPLPENSNVLRGIEGYSATNNESYGIPCDSVTIVLRDLTNVTKYDPQAVLNIASSLKSADGKLLTNGGDIPIPFNVTTSYGNNSTEKVSNLEDLQKALNNSDYRTVKLSDDFSMKAGEENKTLTIKRPVVLDLNSRTIGCNVSIKYEDTGKSEIKGGTIADGKTVTIDTPYASVNVDGLTASVIYLNQIIKSTLTINDSTIGQINVTDSDGAKIETEGTTTISTIVLDTEANTAVVANGTSTIGQIQVKKVATVTLDGDHAEAIQLITTYSKDVTLNNISDQEVIAKVEPTEIGQEPTYQKKGNTQSKDNLPDKSVGYAKALDDVFNVVKADVKALVVSGSAADVKRITVSGSALGADDENDKVELSIQSEDKSVVDFEPIKNVPDAVNAVRGKTAAKVVKITVTIKVTVDGVEREEKRQLEINPNEPDESE